MRNIESAVNFLKELKELHERYGLRLVCDDPYCCPYDAISDIDKDGFVYKWIDEMIEKTGKNEKIWVTDDLNYEPIEKK